MQYQGDIFCHFILQPVDPLYQSNYVYHLHRNETIFSITSNN